MCKTQYLGHKESKKSKIKILPRQIFFPTGFAGIWTQRLSLPSPTRYHYATCVEGGLAQKLVFTKLILIL